MIDNNITTRKVLSYVISTLKPFPIGLTVMFGVNILWAVDLSLSPYLLKMIVNRATENMQGYEVILPMVCYLLMLFSLMISYRIYDYFVDIKMIPQWRCNIAGHAFDLLLNKTHSFYLNSFAGSLTNKVNNLTASIPEYLNIVIDKFFRYSLSLLIAIFTLWQVNTYFALFMIAWIIIYGAIILRFSTRLTIFGADWANCASIITGKIVDTLSNMLSVRLFANKKHERQILEEACDNAAAAETKMEWTYLWLWSWCSILFLILQILNFYLLYQGKQEGWITAGDFALVAAINVSIINFIWDLSTAFSQFSKHSGRIIDSLQMIFAQADIIEAPNAQKLLVTKGEIRFEQVSFKYELTNHIADPAKDRYNVPLFQDKSVVIESGQKVGLVGYSGSGKTTFVNLILRLYGITSGRILIDGQDIRDVTHDSLHNAIAMIPQDPLLFHRTLMENIRYGSPRATDEEVIEAAKKAYAHEFIAALPAGYNSLVGERGVKLSGGQRQRIAISRAILKNSPILILDEATSQLDSVTEGYIQESLWQLMQNKTTIVIAHRLSTLMRMDRILVFEQGKIIEDGTHENLLAKNGVYKTLWDKQVGGFLPENR